MNFILNKELIENSSIPIDEILYMLALYLKKEVNINTIKGLHKKGYIIEHESTHIPRYTLTKGGIEMIEMLLVNSEFKGNNTKDDRFDILAQSLREIFPAGKKPGTNYQWRDSNIIIAKRLRALVKKYNVEFTNEEAIEATKKYVESFNGDYRYMQLLKYFIFKKKALEGDIEETSQLLSFIENAGQDNINTEWTATLV